MENKELKKIIDPLICWYQISARELPWRKEPTAYGVWVSEIMLQQTRVEAVKEYYIRFMNQLPTIKDLAEVSQEKLLKLWQGLGYYNRAKNMQKAAIEVMEKYHGKLPMSYEALLKLKGIGEYTAGAICSIAFGLPEAAVDGNVLRVMTRLTVDDRDIMTKEVKKDFSHEIKEILQHTNPSIFNQALMELGATICLPNGLPKCGICPLKQYCQAYKENRMMDFPYKAAKKTRKIENRIMFFIFFENKVALRKRTEKGLLSNLWELPNILSEENISPFQQLLNWGILSGKVEPLGKAKHIFTHIQWNMEGYFVKVNNLQKQQQDFVWVTEEEMQKYYALPSAFRHYIKKGWEEGKKEHEF